MPISVNEFDYLRDLVRKHCAISIDHDKQYLAESRLMQLAYREKHVSVEALLAHMRAKPFGSLHRQVLDAMTNNETWFFRDLHPFEMLRYQVLPQLMASRSTARRLNVWSAAASSGQEAYSLAMMMDEHFPELRNWAVRILGTDFSSAILNRARAGKYSQLEVNRGLPVAMLMRYFDREGLDWVLKPGIRSRVSFEEMNLAQDWPPRTPMDVILLRNVLIYFEIPVKQRILERARQALTPDGFLFLGSAESMLNLCDAFERVDCGRAACYRRKR